MDIKQINENLLIERYLQGTLTREEEEAFEEAFVASPELLDHLEAAERLGEGLKDLYAEDGQAIPAPGRSAFPRLFHSPRYALAATVFLAVSLVFTGTLYRQNLELSATPEASGAVPTKIVPLYSVRSADSSAPFNTVEPGETGSLVLMLDPGFENYSHYRATLARLSGENQAETLLQLGNMQPGYEDMLAMGVPSGLLGPGDYEVRIEGWRSEWPADREFEQVNRVTFRVR